MLRICALVVLVALGLAMLSCYVFRAGTSWSSGWALQAHHGQIVVTRDLVTSFPRYRGIMFDPGIRWGYLVQNHPMNKRYHMPIWPALIAVSGVCGFVIKTYYNKSSRLSSTSLSCRCCGYDCIGLRQCPECGAVLE